MIELRDTKDFAPNILSELFHSVGWELDTPDPVLQRAMKSATIVLSAWGGQQLVGIIRTMGDDCWSTNIDCLVVHADYQRQGIGSMLLTELLFRCKDVGTISVSPNEYENVSFYKKFGFSVIEGSRLLQIYNC